MNILIACEFSGIVRDAFIKRGHTAISCDLLESESELGLHYKGDVRDIITDKWDMMIAFPPCTYLCSSGLHWNKRIPGRDNLTEKALEFVYFLMSADIEKIAIENPRGCISTRIRKFDQIIHPWQFGHGETKGTCLWLKGLPKLIPTNIVDGRIERIHNMPDTKERAKKRSVTFKGIAEAMAEQWG